MAGPLSACLLNFLLVGASSEGNEDEDDGIALHLFRRVLRLHDNEAFSFSVNSCPKLIALYIFQEKELDPEILGVNRLDFLLQSLTCLAEGLLLHPFVLSC